MTAGSPGNTGGGNLPHGHADDRDDSSKTTPASDLQADDAISPGLSDDLGADGTPAERGQSQGERREQDRRGPGRREHGPSETRARTAMKQEGRTGEDR